MRAYGKRIFSKWDGGLNRIEKPTPKNCYQVGTNVRMTEMFRPERRAGTGKEGVVGVNKPILGATKYYPTGDTALFVAVVDNAGGSASDVYYGSSIGSLSAASMTMTAGATPYFATFPVNEGSIVDSLFVFNGNEEIYYDPSGSGTWSTLAGASMTGGFTVTGLTHICTHGDRLWMTKNNYIYYSAVAGTVAASLLSDSNYLDFAYEGDGNKAVVSLGNDLVVYRRNSIGVFRGKDPNSGVQITAQVKGSGIAAVKTLVVATYRGQKAIYGLSLQGLSVFNGYTSKLIDDRMDIIGLLASAQIGTACAGLYNNRYLLLSFRSTDGTVNDTTIVYDTLKDIFVSTDEGYYPNCYFVLGGGTDKGELWFGTSKSLGAIHSTGDGTDDESPVTSGTDVDIDMTFKIGDEDSGESTRQTRLRQAMVAADTTPGAYARATLEIDNGKSSFQTTFADTRKVAHTWDESGLEWDAVMDDQIPPQPDEAEMVAQGFVWGGSEEMRNIFKWNLPMAVGSPHSYALQIKQENQDTTFNIVEMAVAEKPRMPD